MTSTGQPPPCSRRGCRAVATVDLRWRNPRIHDETRVKHWPACAEHVEYLAGFLSLRGFLQGQGPVEPAVTDELDQPPR